MILALPLSTLERRENKFSLLNVILILFRFLDVINSKTFSQVDISLAPLPSAGSISNAFFLSQISFHCDIKWKIFFLIRFLIAEAWRDGVRWRRKSKKKTFKVDFNLIKIRNSARGTFPS
jgi:hypothetical protein